MSGKLLDANGQEISTTDQQQMAKDHLAINDRLVTIYLAGVDDQGRKQVRWNINHNLSNQDVVNLLQVVANSVIEDLNQERQKIAAEKAKIDNVQSQE